MTNQEYSNYDIGCIIGRFQVHELHEGHRQLIDTVCQHHKKIIIFVGDNPQITRSKRNPLGYKERECMLREAYPNVTIMPLPDRKHDEVWSKNLDSRIREVYPTGSVLLYGGRDSFISHYRGQFKCEELKQDIFVSGTEVRKNIKREVLSSPDFRAGAIYQVYNRYDQVYPTVDIALFDGDLAKLLLGKKPNENKYRFIGGFVDPKDKCLEDSASRELKEEAGPVEISRPQYVGSYQVNDWRYKKEADKIMTSLFWAQYSFGTLEPGDDISEIKYFHISEIIGAKALGSDEKLIQYWMDCFLVEEHHPLMLDLISRVILNPTFNFKLK